MPEQDPIERYLDEVYAYFKVMPKEEAERNRVELRQHITEAVANLMSEGRTENAAVQEAIRRCGSPKRVAGVSTWRRDALSLVSFVRHCCLALRRSDDDDIPFYVTRMTADEAQSSGLLGEMMTISHRVLTNDPNDAAAHLMLGNVYCVAGDLAKARDQWRLVLELEPDVQQEPSRTADEFLRKYAERRH